MNDRNAAGEMAASAVNVQLRSGRVVDISLEGQGMMLSDPGIRLEPGTILPDCRIVYPGRRPVVVDLEIRYLKAITNPDGSESRRVGCRFLGAATDIADLVKLFSINLNDIP